ncbi:MAG: type II toxin-antitoxin system death-on-curing family toxin [Robiginitomaculum sp.]|nr:type II toxin-antitoxin system death-on-curing family toxin [Robiginitomaculum sp.]
MSRVYLSVVDVLAIHDQQLSLYGGADGVRDAGQLEAALFRPQSGYYDDLITEAAALWESLSQNHPFVDGNKRTAYVATYAFLQINGVRIIEGHQETWKFLNNLYETRDLNFERLEVWLRANTSSVNI